jgi:hypothetical protein
MNNCASDLFRQVRDAATNYVLTLENVPIERAPQMSGIYFVVDGNDRVVYVGSAVDIQQRWRGHRLRAMAISSGFRLFYKQCDHNTFMNKEREESWFTAVLWPEYNRIIKCKM